MQDQFVILGPCMRSYRVHRICRHLLEAEIFYIGEDNSTEMITEWTV